MFNGQSILITGGTGSLGKTIAKLLLEKYPGIKMIRLFSRDELKHFHTKAEFLDFNDKMEYLIGDVRDYDRLEESLQSIDFVIHAAAMKQVGACEANPQECFKTNVVGTQNLIKAVNHSMVSKVLFVSSDKAVEPVSVYGNSKQAGEKLILNTSNDKITFSTVRLGNLLGSSGSVVPLFVKLKNDGVIPITHPEITRFCGTLIQGAQSIIYALINMRGGEIFIPKWDAFRIVDLAEAISPGCKHKIIGLRKYEKLHEKLIGDKEFENLFENDGYFIYLNAVVNIDQALDRYKAVSINENVYSSSSTKLLSTEDLATILVNRNSPHKRLEI